MEIKWRPYYRSVNSNQQGLFFKTAMAINIDIKSNCQFKLMTKPKSAIQSVIIFRQKKGHYFSFHKLVTENPCSDFKGPKIQLKGFKIHENLI